MKILILGGDGYLGWPTAMHFSNRGYEWGAVVDTDLELTGSVYTAYKASALAQGSGYVYFRIFEYDAPHNVNYYRSSVSETDILLTTELLNVDLLFEISGSILNSCP